MASVEELLIKLTADNTDLKKKLGESEKGVSKFGDVVGKVGPMIAGAFTVGAAVSFGKAIIDITAKFQTYNAVLKTTLGSQMLASNAMQMISDFASSTPFSVDQLTSSFVKLANQGFTPTKTQMRQMGDLAASTGKGFDQLAEGIIDATVGEFERLKEFGIKARSEGDKVTFSFKGVQTQVENNSTAINAYVLGLGDLSGVMGSMAGISETLGGKISNLGDAYDQWLVGLGEKSSGLFISIAEEFTAMLNNMSSAMSAAEFLKSAVVEEEGFFGGDLANQEATRLMKLQKSLIGASTDDINAAIVETSKRMGFYTGEVGDDLNKMYSKFMGNLTAMIMTPVNTSPKGAAAASKESIKRFQDEFEKKGKAIDDYMRKVHELGKLEAGAEITGFDMGETKIKSLKTKGITQPGDGAKLMARGQKELGQAVKTTNSDLERQRNNLSSISEMMAGLGQVAGSAFGEQSAAYKAFAIVSATISTYLAATAALAPPPMGYGPVAGIPAAIGITAMGLANVAHIAGAFASGGIVGGGSYTGDNLTAKVNSGEMILNGNQQRELFSMANGMGQRNQVEVVGYISGDVIRLANKRSEYVANRRG